MIFFRQIIKFFIIEFLYNGHLQSLGSLGVFVFSSLFLEQDVNITELFSIYLVFYLIYFYNRYKENKIDYLTNKARSCHIKILLPYIKPVFFACLSVLAILILYAHNFNFAFWLSMIFLGGILYTDIFKPITKKILIFKNFYVASVFTLLVFLPLIINNKPIKLTVIILSLFIFWRALKMQIILDLKDIKSDSILRLKTLGVLYGEQKAWMVVAGINIINLTMLVFSLHYLQGKIIILLIIFCLIFDFISYYLFKRKSPVVFLLAGSEFIFLPILALV